MSNKNELIHSTAVIEEGAQVASDVKIGPYCVIGENVIIGSGCELKAHVTIAGHTTIGEKNIFHSMSVIGGDPQDLSYKGEPTQLRIGNNNVFREFVSINKGTLKQDHITIVGNSCLLMAYTHLGHDVVLGDNVIMANACNIAGHVKLGDRVYLGGGTNISQFVTLGKGAYIGGGSGIDRDIPDFCTAYGNRVRLKGVNIIGLKRQGYEKSHISELVDFYRMMEASTLSPRAFVDNTNNWLDYKENILVHKMVEFISSSKIGIAPFMS